MSANRWLAIWLFIDALRCTVWFRYTLELPDAITAIGLLVLVMSVWRRTRPQAALTSPLAWVVTLGSLVVPLLYTGLPDVSASGSARLLRACGASLFLWSALSLRDCFSVLPQSRRVVTTGPYRWMRHPMYLAYLIADAAYWFPDGMANARGLWFVEAGLLCVRATLEERCLVQTLGSQSNRCVRSCGGS